MPHPKMRESIMTPSAANIALADEVLQCNGGIPKCYCRVGLVVHSFACPAAYRPAVALALQSKDDDAAREIDRLKGEIARLRAALKPFAGISGGLAGSIIGKMARHSISVLNTPDYPEASAEVELTKQIMDAVPKARAALLTEGGKL